MNDKRRSYTPEFKLKVVLESMQAVLYWCVTVSMSGNRIDEQLCDSRAERSQP